MGSTRESSRLPRLAGGALGGCIAVAAIVLALPGGGRGGVLPATLDVAVRSSGAIAALPADPSVVLHAGGLRPGAGGRAATFELANESGKGLAVGLRAQASSTELDGVVRLRVSAGRRTVVDSTVGQLRAGGSTPLPIAPGARRSLRIAAWIPGEVETGYEGREVRVELLPTLAGGGVR
jgi:hypothetical protein